MITSLLLPLLSALVPAVLKIILDWVNASAAQSAVNSNLLKETSVAQAAVDAPRDFPALTVALNEGKF